MLVQAHKDSEAVIKRCISPWSAAALLSSGGDAISQSEPLAAQYPAAIIGVIGRRDAYLSFNGSLSDCTPLWRASADTSKFW